MSPLAADPNLASELSLKWIFWELVSKVPPSCGVVSLTKSVLIPERFDPSPLNDVAVQVPATVIPALEVSNFLVPS